MENICNRVSVETIGVGTYFKIFGFVFKIMESIQKFFYFTFLYSIYKKIRFHYGYFYSLCLDSNIYSTVFAMSCIASLKSGRCPDSCLIIGLEESVRVHRHWCIESHHQSLIFILIILQFNPFQKCIESSYRCFSAIIFFEFMNIVLKCFNRHFAVFLRY